MTALRRRHQLMASLHGLVPGDGRKTFKRRAQRRPHEMPDYRLTVLIPEPWCLGAPGCGAPGFAGITVEPDQISGPLAVATGKGLEWCMTQLGRFLLSIAGGDERILSASVMRDGECFGQPIAITPGVAEFPRRSRKTLRVTA